MSHEIFLSICMQSSAGNVGTIRNHLQARRATLNAEIGKEDQLRKGSKRLVGVTLDHKTRDQAVLEMNFAESKIKVLQAELAKINSSLQSYQTERWGKQLWEITNIWTCTCFCTIFSISNWQLLVWHFSSCWFYFLFLHRSLPLSLSLPSLSPSLSFSAQQTQIPIIPLALKTTTRLSFVSCFSVSLLHTHTHTYKFTKTKIFPTGDHQQTLPHWPLLCSGLHLRLPGTKICEYTLHSSLVSHCHPPLWSLLPPPFLSPCFLSSHPLPIPPSSSSTTLPSPFPPLPSPHLPGNSNSDERWYRSWDVIRVLQSTEASGSKTASSHPSPWHRICLVGQLVHTWRSDKLITVRVCVYVHRYDAINGMPAAQQSTVFERVSPTHFLL